MAGEGTSRVDAHCHYWRLARGDYGWLDGSGGPLEPIRRDFGEAEMRPLASAAGIDRRILVQAAPTLNETRFLLEEAKADGQVAGVVGWVDLSSPDAERDIEALGADPMLRSVRPMLQDLPDPDWIATDPRREAIEALKRRGLRFDALVLPGHLKPLLRFTERYPELPVIIDHVAKPAFGAPANDPRHAMLRDGLQVLAGNPRIFCKLSGLLTEMPPELRQTPDEAAGTLRLLLDDLLRWFGPERIAWGSDWPVLTLAAPFAFWDEATDRLLAPLGADDRAAILGRSASRFYGLDAGEAA